MNIFNLPNFNVLDVKETEDDYLGVPISTLISAIEEGLI